MAIYYVRKDGNDTTGDGSTGAPWLTISKALLTVSIGGGHTVNIGAGTYQENTSSLGYLYLARLFLAEVIIQSESGNAADVIVQSATSTSFTIRLAASSNITLKDLTITPRLNTMTHCIRCQDVGASYFKLDGCTLITSGAGNSFVIYFTQPVTNFSLLDSTITEVSTATATGVRLQTAGHDNITISGCTITTGATCIYQSEACSNLTITDTTCTNTGSFIGVRVDFVDGLTVDNLSVTSTGAGATVAFRIGNDGDYGTGNATRDFTIRNCRFESVNSHGCLISSDAQDGIMEYCTVVGGDQGAVLKGIDNVTIRHCTISTALGGRAAYFKDARHCTFHSNRVIAYAGNTLSADGAQHNRWVYNVVEAHNSAQIYLWTGTNVMIESDNNHYILTGAAVWGNPNGVTANSLAEVRAAWTGTFANNDTKSNQLRLES